MDYETVLERVGGCGRFQLIAFCILFVCNFKVAFDIQSLVLATYTLTFVCANSISNQTCHMTATDNDTEREPCTQWNYSNKVMRKTMVTEMDLVCDRAYLATLAQTLTFVGAMIGMLLGSVGDIIGRRKMLLIQTVWDTVFTIMIAFCPGIYPQLTLRFLRALSSGIYYQGFTYITEIVSMKYRMRFGCNYWMMWCIGYTTCAGFGKWLQDWRLLQGVSACITVVYISYFFILPESPRWLTSKGRNEEAAEVFAKIARWNGKQVPNEYLANVKLGKEPKAKLSDLFRSKQMCLKTISCWSLLWSIGCVYMGMSLHSSFASDDIFLNMAIMGLIELPANPFGWKVSDKFGRRKSTLIFNIITAGCLIAVPFLGGTAWGRIIIAALGKFLITASYCVADVWITECFPTCIRNMGMFTSAMFSYIAYMVAPLILAIKKPVKWMPEAIFSVQTLIVLLVLLILPETLGAPMLQTVEEADLLVRGKEYEIEERLNVRRRELRRMMTLGDKKDDSESNVQNA